MNVLAACMYMYHFHACAYGGQKMVSNHLELELQMFVSCYVGAETWNSSVLPEQQVLVSADTSPHCPIFILINLLIDFHSACLVCTPNNAE